MPIIENGKAVFVDLDGKLKLVPAEQADAAAQQMGWSEATAAQIAADDARKAELQKPVVEQVAGAALGGLASIGGAIGSAIPEALGGMSPEEERQAGEFLRSPTVTGQRLASPTAFSIGQSAPEIAAGLLLPGAGYAGLAATIGVDVASGAGQAAVDAELENRQISGTDILRNAGLNLAFSLPLYGLGEGARLALRGTGKNALEAAADVARDTAGRRATAAEGQELAQAVADPAVQADLLDRVSANAEDAVSRAHDRIVGLSPPVVARNPNAQREAVGAIADVTRTANPDLAARLDALTKGSSKKRLAGLRELRDELAAAGDSDTLAALDATIGREDLWGSKAVRGASDIDAVIGSRPGPGAAPEELIDYAGKLRQVQGGEFAGMADEIEQLAERQIEIRTAATIGDVAPGAANDVVDYAAAMRTIDPNEAWRLTRDGADDGLRQLESTSVSDAMQRVDDVLREDVAMSVKREDFVKGAESWTPAQVAKQTSWGDTMRGRALALAGELDTADARGFRIGGFRAEATDLIDRAVQRLADADPVTANHEWDNLKRSLDSLGKRLAASQNLDEASKVWGTKKVLELSDDMRKGLEDAELWGRNAGLQKETNAAWVNIIDPYSRVTKKMAEFLGHEFGVVGQAGIRRRFDPDMINSIMSRGYQKNLRADIDASIKGLDQMMQARQSQGLSHLDRLSKAREDLIRIRQGFDFADLLAVAKTKAKAPIGLDVVGRLANTATPGGLVGSVVGPVASRVSDALVGDMAMLKPGSKSMLSGAVRRHIGLSRGEQAAMLAGPAFFERLPASLQKQVMAGSAANDRAIQLAQTAADAAQRDRELTARLMVHPAEAKRAAKLTRKTPAIDRARARASQGGAVVIGKPSESLAAKTWIAIGKRAREGVSPETADALRVYEESGYRGVNSLLRTGTSGKPQHDSYFRGIADKVIAHLERQKRLGNTVSGTVFREVNGEHLAGLKPGDTWADPGVLSASREYTAAQGFDTGDSPVILELQQASGVPHYRRQGTRINREQEVLIAPNTQFEVVSEAVKPNRLGQDTRHIVMREVRAAPPVPGVERGMADIRIGGKESPVSLVGKSLKDLGALSDPTTLKPETLAALREGQGFAADFGTTGRVAQKGQAEQGIQVEIRNGQPFLVDGRHRRMVVREKGLGTVCGQIYRGARAPGKKPIFEGPIPIGPQAKPRGGERGVAILGGNRAPLDGPLFVRKSEWTPTNDAERAVADRIAAVEADPDYIEDLAELSTPGELRAWFFKAVSDRPDDSPFTDAQLKAAIKSAVDTIDHKATYKRAADRVFGPEAGGVNLGKGPNFSFGDVVKSPMGVGTGAAGALGTYAALKEPAMPDPESQTPLQRFSEGYDRPSDAFRAARKMVLDWQRNPGALVDMIDGHIGDVGQQSPKLAREMTQQAMRIAAYLQDNLPGQRNVSVVYPDGTPPSRAEVRQFALRFDAAVNPAGVLADGRAGRLERTQVDTLQALWPQEYDALRAGVLEELGKGKATPQMRQRMSLLFSFPSGVDPALGARTRAIVAAARGAQDAAKKPAPSSPGMNRQRLPSTATMQPAGMAALSLGQQIGSS